MPSLFSIAVTLCLLLSTIILGLSADSGANQVVSSPVGPPRRRQLKQRGNAPPGAKRGKAAKGVSKPRKSGNASPGAKNGKSAKKGKSAKPGQKSAKRRQKASKRARSPNA